MSATDVAVHLGTGEVLERLDEQPPETLAEALDLVLAREAEVKRWRDALEGELRRRLKIRQAKVAVFGDWEVEASTSRESVWDADELERAMRRLVDEGVVRAGDVADVITREPVVSRSGAKALASRLTGDAKAAVEAARSWREKPGRVTVARSVELPTPAELGRPAPAQAPAPPDPSPDGDGRPQALPEAAQAPAGPEAAAKPPEPPNAPPRDPGAPQAPPDLNPEELFA